LKTYLLDEILAFLDPFSTFWLTLFILEGVDLVVEGWVSDLQMSLLYQMRDLFEFLKCI